MSKWTIDAMPDQSGRLAVVTGANSGLGLHTARALAEKGARVVMACRSRAKAETARDEIARGAAGAEVEIRELNLADLASVRAFSEALAAENDRLDLLCNNAGIMAIPFARTADGFEMQFGTNHLGHFALSGHLIELLLATEGSRVVNVSSNAHNFGRMRFDDPHWSGGYRRWTAYEQSKLANLLFTRGLSRRLAAAGSSSIAASSHPGYAATNLPLVGPELQGWKLGTRIARLGNRLIAQSAEMGALPTLFAATDESVRSGDYIGPDGRFEQSGHPKRVQPRPKGRDPEAARRLWELSVEQTGVNWSALPG